MSTETDVRRILREIQREAGLDPDGPARPMQPRRLLRAENRRLLQRAREIDYRDAALRRAIMRIG